MGATRWGQRVMMAITASGLTLAPGPLAATGGCVAALRSPFPDRDMPVSAAPEAYDCAEAPAPVVSLDAISKYDQESPNRDKLDAEAAAAFEAEMEGLREFQKLVVRAANASRLKPEQAQSAADCASAYIVEWVRADALSDMQSHTAQQHRSIYVGTIALAWLQVRDRNDKPLEQTEVEAWLATRAEEIVTYFGDRNDKPSGRNNHRYWAGAAVAASGIATGRCDLYAWGTSALDIALAQVTAEGYLPLELDRGTRARDYHLYALAPLMLLALMEKNRGRDVMADHNGALRRLVAQTLDAVADPGAIAEKTGEEQIAFTGEDGAPKGHQMAWFVLLQQIDPDFAAGFDLELPQPLAFTSLGGDLAKLFN
ncbi:alginate lyase family protein [Albidovulum sediminicola]|uniref:Alginate lyase family protein n=1 Tax=Albidovulum sediminicola TaxID=2984331 RepID=A0ABT2Z4J5_9RHOB|nr:alginate lyase family protein [Defluviimonas sp. WL0075]MCV2866059.1 alginate lyase family protein [Defluviimonas sp. WL0075]